MAVIISWIKRYSAINDGEVLGGQDLGDIQTAIEQHSHTDVPLTILVFPDMPNSYSGYSGYYLRVNNAENGFEFARPEGTILSYTKAFTSSDVAPDGTITVNHNLGDKYVLVQVYNNNDEMVMPDAVNLNSANACTIKLSSYNITGIWHIKIIS